MTTEAKPKTLAELITERIIAKRAEDAAIETRKTIDEQIVALLPKPDGKNTASQKLPDLSIKCSVSYGTNVSVDAEALRADADAKKVNDAVLGAFKWKPEVIGDNLKALSPDDKLAAAKYITTKSASPSVKLEVI